MPPCLLSTRPPSLLVSCSASPGAAVGVAVAVRSPPQPPSPSLSLDSTTALPSLSCSLQCSHFQSCSGCTHEFNLHRPVIVDEATDFFKNHGVSDFTFDTCRLYGWRCRAKLAVRGISMSPLIGLYQEGTHNVADIPDCKAHHPGINAAVELLRQGSFFSLFRFFSTNMFCLDYYSDSKSSFLLIFGIKELNIEPYDEDQGTGDLRYVQMAVTTHNTSLRAAERYRNGKVQITLVWNSRNEKSSNSDKLDALAKFLWRNGGSWSKNHHIHSVWANFQTSTTNVIFGNRWRHLLGESDFWEHVGGIDISLTPSSFGQANTRAFDVLLRKLQKYVPHGASVTDLYAGAGVIGLSLAASRNCRQEPLVKCSGEPLSWLVGSDVLVVDPPRKGLDKSLVDALQTISSVERKAKFSSESSSVKEKEEKRPWILRAREASVQIGSKTDSEDSRSFPRTLIYISCGWESFKEDCKSLLSSKAWRLEKAHGFNFFPGTQSIEVLAVFKRGQAVGLKKKKSGKKKKKKSSL
ncbi:hypothetical protein EZV62_020115 [Acer yangbiense]|uniref:Methyltransferase small domain-containing protein n=1 Tax=Acer yangbiense TaxID=1000413 RepID=A0A5C7HDC6_9ROSI|nr:hypothetical protein EZV62_020115 [Acer yangbiense]